MSGFRSADLIEWAVDGAAASALAGAAWYASTAFAPTASSAATALGAAVALAGLRTVQPARRRLGVPEFEAVTLMLDHAPGELVLGEEDRLVPLDASDGAAAAELLLDDILAELEPDSRVVRLFEPRQVPTPGELHRSIDRHLHQRGGMIGPPDASQALSDALAELRRSLR